MYRHFVYKTTNLLNGHFYIGKHSTRNVEDGYLGSGSAFCAALIEFGRSNFKREILAELESSDDAFELEAWYVDMDMISRTDCYNTIPGGKRGYIDCPMPPKTRLKIGAANKGKKSRLGAVLSVETKRKISDSKRGKNITQEHKDKVSMYWSGRKRKPRTQEHKDNLSRSLIGVPRPKSKDFAEKIRKLRTGQIWVKKDDLCKLISPDDLQNHLSAGWVRGKHHKRI